MTKDGVPIYKVSLKTTTVTGIDVANVPGIIPEFYERNACNASNYQFDTSWKQLTLVQKSDVLAHYLLNNQIESHIQDTQISETKRRSKRK